MSLLQWWRELWGGGEFGDGARGSNESGDFLSSRSPKKFATFSFETIETKHLGVIKRPIAHVKFWSPEYREWQDHTMLIDTGADFTVLPMYMAGLLGLDMSNATVIKTNGIEGSRKISFIEGVRVKLGSVERVIPVGIAHTSRIPPLMGRHQFFETFQTRFEGSERVVFGE